MRVEALKSLSFVERGENVVLLGNSGTGKARLAIALGVEACAREMDVLYASLPNLVVAIRESMSASQLCKFKRCDLVIFLDEMGYITFEKELNELLFNVLSARSQSKSVIVATNFSFDRWTEIFKDPMLAAAIADRLAHKAHVLQMPSESYRLKETMEWLSSQSGEG